MAFLGGQAGGEQGACCRNASPRHPTPMRPHCLGMKATLGTERLRCARLAASHFKDPCTYNLSS